MGDLERLNKERDLVGIYLSAHPLDEYAVILENVCNVHMAELADLTPLQNRDLTMGGIVTAVREGIPRRENHTVLLKWKIIRAQQNLLSLVMNG